MTTVLNIEDRRELFVDRLLIESMEGCALKLHEPVSGGTAIQLDRPWEGVANFGSSVVHDGNRYLMYYRAFKAGADKGLMCMATSTDGVSWEKPSLGLVEYDGRRNTNAIAGENGFTDFDYNGGPWLDTRAGVPENERFKAFTSEALSGEKHTPYVDPQGPKKLVPWVSADGVTFRKLADHPGIISNLPNCFDGGNTLFWSETEEAYVLYYRFYEGEWGEGGRSMARTTSKDFWHWSEPQPMTYGDTPREQFYTNNTIAYFRAPHCYLALAARFMEGRQVLTADQANAIGLKTSHGSTYSGDCSDAVLMTSRAGSTQYDRTFMEAFIRPGFGYSNWVSRTNYPLTGIFPCGTDRMMMFVNRHYMQDSWHIEKLLMRLDGFGSVTAPWTGGEMLTVPFTFRGDELVLNYRTSAAGRVQVEIQNAAGLPLEGFTLTDCDELIGDEIERTVSWRHCADVAGLAGQPVRLRIAMKDADLFSLRFHSNDRSL